MVDLLEILVCVLAVFGAYTVLRMIKTNLLYPRKVRLRLRGAVVIDEEENVCALARYAAYLRSEQKISSERLIILLKDDIMKDSEYLGDIGESFAVYKINTYSNKERNDDT